MSGLFISLRAISTDSAIFGADLWSMVPAPSLSELASAEFVNFHLIGVLREGTALATNQQNTTATQLAATDKCQVTGVQMDRQYIISHSETHSFTLWLWLTSPWYRWPIEIDDLPIKTLFGSVVGIQIALTHAHLETKNQGSLGD